ncbi:hypothetical protein M501DRAFT_511876 [Patellaria atrata CBS 101060]|uniref:Uncharacterized protein n=1 Tax=Patellaria atrata CBS 101060 TaxID=1346257 RepID=A0A9P4S1U7_9PEZI|nr:hypothetical protein M501DRAFT_511876 [Patellaria atrata CBS 101060]
MEPIASETADQSAEVERGYQAVESQPQVENEQRGNGADVTPDEQPPITTHGSEADETKQSESEQHLPPQHPETEEGGRRTPTLAYPLQELGELSMAERGEHSSGEETLIDDSSSVRTRAYDSSSSAQTLVDDDSTTDDASSFVDDGFS